MSATDGALAPIVPRTAEFALVVACSAWPFTPARAAIARGHAAQVRDWERVIAVVDRHRVGGLVQHGLQAAGIAPPAPVAAALARRARDNAMRELSFAAETIRLVRRLEGAGVPTRVLKGATVALAAFGRFGVRYSMDIDLLVAKAAIPRAAALLGEAGYVRTEPLADATPRAMRARMSRAKDLVFEHPVTGAIIELHWRLFQNPWLLRDATAAAPGTLALVGGATVSVLPAETLPLYLCAHGAEHGWMRLKWLADVGALLGTGGADADALYAAARARSLTRLVGPGLLLSHHLFGTVLPAALARDLARDWRMRSLYRTACRSLIGDEDGLELDARALGTARKNLSHYLFTNDPRFWLSELRYDLLDDGGVSDAEGGSRIWRRLQRLRRILVREGVAPAG